MMKEEMIDCAGCDARYPSTMAQDLAVLEAKMRTDGWAWWRLKVKVGEPRYMHYCPACSRDISEDDVAPEPERHGKVGGEGD